MTSADKRDEFARRRRTRLRAGCTGRGCETTPSGFRAGPRSRRRERAVCARARPARHIPATSDIFWPKPPPTSGAMTRSSASGMPSRSAMPVRIRCGICVVQVSVTRPTSDRRRHGAARASSGVAFCRRERMSIATRAMRGRHARRRSPAVSHLRLDADVARRLVHARAARRRASAARASMTAGISADLTVTSSAISSASALGCRRPRRRSARRQSAPRSVGQHRLRDRHIAELVQRRDGSASPPARSAAVKTVAPSGSAILSMRPAATGLRTNRTRCAAGRSAVKRPRPVQQRRVFEAPDRAADPGQAGAFGRRGHAAARSSARRVTARTRSRRNSASACTSSSGSIAAAAAASPPRGRPPRRASVRRERLPLPRCGAAGPRRRRRRHAARP